MLSNLRYAFRQLAKSPGFTLIAVLTLALGIGACTAIFSVVNSTLLRPLPYPDSERLVEIWTKSADSGNFPFVSGAQFKQWRDHATSFDGIAAIHDRHALNLIDQGSAERVAGAEVSANYLDVLRLPPLLGRGFQPREDEMGFENHVMILTYEWWRTRFGGDPAIIGRTMNFNRLAYTVVGVLPPHALAQDRLCFLVPLVLDDFPWRMDPANPWMNVTARLKTGVNFAQASAETTALTTELYARVLPDRKMWGNEVLRMQQVLVENSRPTFLILLGAVALVLLIACANVANLLLVRAAGRQKEMAVRLALGAGTGRIVRQMLTESVFLSLCGGALGTLVAAFSIKLLQNLTATIVPGLMQPEIDLRVLAFSLLIACGTGVIFGLMPALQACRTDVNRNLKETGRGLTSGSRTRTQSILIAAEVALTVMLLVGAGLLLRSFARVLAADTGFDARQALVCDVSLTQEKFTTEETVRQYEDELVRRVQALPGVEAVGTTTTLPLSENAWGTRVGRSDRPAAEHNQGSMLDYVGADYFRAMGIRLLKGRLLADADNSTQAPPVAVVNDEFAAKLFPGVDPLGRRIRFKNLDWEIVGVVSSVRHRRVDAQAQNHIYAGHAYEPRTICLVVRTKVPPLSLVDEIRKTGAAFDPDQSLANFRTLEQLVSHALKERRVTLYLLGIFAGVALALACLGIYGVMTYTIQQRERELGIRLALGASYRDVVRLMLRDGIALGIVGIVIGLGGAIGGAQLIASRLYEVKAFDPVIFATVPALVAAVMIIATYLPARRAAKVDPMIALRAE